MSEMPWSIITAADRGNGSLVKKLMLCCTPSSRTVKSFCNKPSTSLPSSSFTVTGTFTKLTVFSRLKSWSRPLSGPLGTLPAGTVLIPSEPGGGGCGLVCPDPGSEPRVFAGSSGFPLDEEEPGSPGALGAGKFSWGAGALFCGMGASGSFCCCAGAKAAVRVSTAARTAPLVQKLNGRRNMDFGCSPNFAGTLHSITGRGGFWARTASRRSRFWAPWVSQLTAVPADPVVGAIQYRYSCRKGSYAVESSSAVHRRAVPHPVLQRVDGCAVAEPSCAGAE